MGLLDTWPWASRVVGWAPQPPSCMDMHRCNLLSRGLRPTPPPRFGTGVWGREGEGGMGEGKREEGEGKRAKGKGAGGRGLKASGSKV